MSPPTEHQPSSDAPSGLLSRDWRLCVDFGTAASKAAIAMQGDWAGDAGRRVKPLPLGLHANHFDPLLVPSAIYVDNDRIFFGPPALQRAIEGGADREPLQSFKMLLGANDLPLLLASLVKRNVDPSGRLRTKDILILYVGYLGALIAECFASDPALGAIQGEVLWRYSRPEWSHDDSGMHDRVTKELFEHGLFIGKALKSDFLSEDGMPMTLALEASNSKNDGVGLIEGSVLEAHAVAAAHAGAAKLASPFVMVFDMGAGTTDFAGFQVGNAPDGRFHMIEIPGARRSIARAGDEVDTLLMNAFIHKARLSKNREEKTALWRLMSSSIRDLKRQAFINDRCAIKFNDKTIILRRNELTTAPAFKAFTGAIQTHFEASLAAVTAAAKKSKVKSISLILAGGGASLPFVQDMAKEAVRSWRKDARVILEPMAPLWTSAPEFRGALAPLFPQLEIAIGGASPLISLAESLKPALAVKDAVA